MEHISNPSRPLAQPLSLRDLDERGFSALAEPHRRALQVHCYRLLGSLQEAEDVTQETLLRAWRRRETYEGRASVGAWLYKIATNLCLNTLQANPRRYVPMTHQTASQSGAPIAPAITEPIWLEPYPDELLAPEDADPEARITQHESVTLAFMTSLHLLPPRQRAILILRDVLDWQASEVAELLGQSVPAVKSALFRARTTLAQYYQTRRPEDVSPAVLNERQRHQLDRYVQAWERADVDGLLDLLKADATFSMPPIPAWYQGREAIGWVVSSTIFGGAAVGRWRLLPTRANGQTAFGVYRLDEASGAHTAYGIQVVTLADDAIADIITFRNPALTQLFRLPVSWPSSHKLR